MYERKNGLQPLCALYSPEVGAGRTSSLANGGTPHFGAKSNQLRKSDYRNLQLHPAPEDPPAPSALQPFRDRSCFIEQFDLQTCTMTTPQAPAKQDDANDKPWYAAFPAPTRSVADGTLDTVSAHELRQRLLDGLKSDELLVVDVRRTDFEVRLLSLLRPPSRARHACYSAFGRACSVQS